MRGRRDDIYHLCAQRHYANATLAQDNIAPREFQNPQILRPCGTRTIGCYRPLESGNVHFLCLTGTEQRTEPRVLNNNLASKIGRCMDRATHVFRRLSSEGPACWLWKEIVATSGSRSL